MQLSTHIMTDMAFIRSISAIYFASAVSIVKLFLMIRILISVGKSHATTQTFRSDLSFDFVSCCLQIFYSRVTTRREHKIDMDYHWVYWTGNIKNICVRSRNHPLVVANSCYWRQCYFIYMHLLIGLLEQYISIPGITMPRTSTRNINGQEANDTMFAFTNRFEPRLNPNARYSQRIPEGTFQLKWILLIALQSNN